MSPLRSIKDLVGGKSTLQNEIPGDLGQEFSSAPEKGEELPPEEPGGALGVGFPGNFGKYTTGLAPLFATQHAGNTGQAPGRSQPENLQHPHPSCYLSPHPLA